MKRAVRAIMAVRAARTIIGAAFMAGLLIRWRAGGAKTMATDAEAVPDGDGSGLARADSREAAAEGVPGRFVTVAHASDDEIQPAAELPRRMSRMSRMPIFNIEVELDLDLAALGPPGARPT
jgi:hypothetical protein